MECGGEDVMTCEFLPCTSLINGVRETLALPFVAGRRGNGRPESYSLPELAFPHELLAVTVLWLYCSW